ncbi:MAG: divalent-cation tolerance protein CutA [Methanobrevibacter sp.]|jgi:periplasmic divalent cation tolerance protein|nr:divalent-cation tolerance protein CutA [Methanobrevibacter sp.]
MMALVYITTSNKEEAIKIGSAIVKERLAACSNIIKDMGSIYWWNGEIENDNEAILLLKTLEKNVSKIIARTKELHSYENPCIVALPIIAGSDSYLEWIKEEVQ